MGSSPSLGRAVAEAAAAKRNPNLSSAAEELTHVPEPRLLGSIDPDQVTNPAPSTDRWTESDGTRVEFTEPPPPWETDKRYFKHDTDARRFVQVPTNWELRWINPRMLDQYGWRDWQPVMRSSPDVKVLVPQMVSPEGNIRRGGQTGDILCWMYRSWVDSRTRIKRERVEKQSATAKQRQDEVTERIRRGEYDGGRGYVKVDSATHPTHTQGDGRTMTDQ